MSQIIGPFTNEILDSITEEFKKPETKEKIINAINPLITELFDRYKIYIIGFSFLQIIIVVLLIIIILYYYIFFQFLFYLFIYYLKTCNIALNIRDFFSYI